MIRIERDHPSHAKIKIWKLWFFNTFNLSLCINKELGIHYSIGVGIKNTTMCLTLRKWDKYINITRRYDA